MAASPEIISEYQYAYRRPDFNYKTATHKGRPNTGLNPLLISRVKKVNPFTASVSRPETTGTRSTLTNVSKSQVLEPLPPVLERKPLAEPERVVDVEEPDDRVKLITFTRAPSKYDIFFNNRVGKRHFNSFDPTKTYVAPWSDKLKVDRKVARKSIKDKKNKSEIVKERSLDPELEHTNTIYRESYNLENSIVAYRKFNVDIPNAVDE